MFFSLCIVYAVNLLPLKENLVYLLEIKQMTKGKNFVVTLIIVIVSTLCAWLYREVTTWIQLSASFAGVLLCFTLPGKLKSQTIPPKKFIK